MQCQRICAASSAAFLILVTGCQHSLPATAAAQAVPPRPAWSATVTIERVERADEVEGYWSLSDEWSGLMGLALEIKGDRFRYWFSSDVRSESEPDYPIEGSFSIEQGMLVLESEQPLYDSEWFLISHGGQRGLFPHNAFKTITVRRESPRTRMLFPVRPTAEWPLYNAPSSRG